MFIHQWETSFDLGTSIYNSASGKTTVTKLSQFNHHTCSSRTEIYYNQLDSWLWQNKDV